MNLLYFIFIIYFPTKEVNCGPSELVLSFKENVQKVSDLISGEAKSLKRVKRWHTSNLRAPREIDRPSLLSDIHKTKPYHTPYQGIYDIKVAFQHDIPTENQQRLFDLWNNYKERWNGYWYQKPYTFAKQPSSQDNLKVSSILLLIMFLSWFLVI